MKKQNVTSGGNEIQVSRADLPGEWLASGENWPAKTLVKVSEDGTYRFGPDLQDDASAYDDRVYEQGAWEFEDSVLSFVSNERSSNCGQGERGDYRLTRLEDGNVMLTRKQDQCTVRSHEWVRFERVEVG